MEAHFRTREVVTVGHVLSSDEKVSCIDGTSKTLFVGTTQGRLFLVDLPSSSIVRMVRLAGNAPVVQIIAATALNHLIALAASSIYNIDISTLKPISSSDTTNISCMALNKDPVVADPFTLQLALATSARQILICENSSEKMKIEQKIRTEGNVIAISYNKYCICYALQNVYCLHNVAENKTLDLFPYDAQTVRPIIVNADAGRTIYLGIDEHFCQDGFLVNGMQGLGVFVNTEGVSSRPPIFWGTNTILSFTYRSPYIFVLTATWISIYGCEQAIELQRLVLDGGVLFECIDGKVYLCSNICISTFDAISWAERAEALLEQNEIEEALRVAEKALEGGDYGEEEILNLQKYNTLKQKIAVVHFKQCRYDNFVEAALSSELDPREILLCCNELLPLPSNFQGVINNADDFQVDDLTSEFCSFLMHYLKKVRDMYWSTSYRRDVDCILLRIISYPEDKTFLSDSLPDLSCSSKDCEEWMRMHNRRKFLTSIALYRKEFREALILCRELYTVKLFDFDLEKLCMDLLPDISSEDLFFDWVRFLLDVCPNKVMTAIERCRLKLAPLAVVGVLEKRRETLIMYLEKIKKLQIASLHKKLFTVYVEEINSTLSEENSDTDAIANLRKKFRIFLLEPNSVDPSYIRDLLKRYRHFTVELTLYEGTQIPHRTSSLEKLLREHCDYDAAELFCAHMDSSGQSLHRYLLEFYLEKLKSEPSFEKRIIDLINSMEWSPCIHEVLENAPGEWPLTSILAFAEKAVISANYRSHSQELKKALAERALRLLSDETAKPVCTAIRVDENTRCATCGALIGNEDIVRMPHSDNVYHLTCVKL